MAEIKLMPNGPLVISNDIKVVKADGSDVEGKGALCRCGHSGNKPFCDGSHQSSDYKSEE